MCVLNTCLYWLFFICRCYLIPYCSDTLAVVDRIGRSTWIKSIGIRLHCNNTTWEYLWSSGAVCASDASSKSNVSRALLSIRVRKNKVLFARPRPVFNNQSISGYSRYTNLLFSADHVREPIVVTGYVMMTTLLGHRVCPRVSRHSAEISDRENNNILHEIAGRCSVPRSIERISIIIGNILNDIFF